MKMKVQVFCDNDADGISACMIFYMMFGKKNRVVLTPLPGPDPEIVLNKRVIADRYVFLDLGATIMDFIESSFGRKAIVIDHHDGPRKNWYVGDYVNPALEGKGSLYYASTSTLVYDYFSADDDFLAFLAITGAVGDIEDVDGDLHGLNKKILKNSGLFVEESYKAPGKAFAPISLVIDTNLFPAVNMSFEEIVKALGPYAFATYPSVKSEIDDVIKSFYGEDWKVAYNPNIIVDFDDVHVEAHDFSLILNLIRMNDVPEFIKSFQKRQTYISPYIVRAIEWFVSFESVVSSIDFSNKNGIIFVLLKNGERGWIGRVANYLLMKHGGKMAIACTENERDVICSLRSYKYDVGKLALVASIKVGGRGGGHSVAAGAKIPKYALNSFLREIENIVKSQSAEKPKF